MRAYFCSCSFFLCGVIYQTHCGHQPRICRGKVFFLWAMVFFLWRSLNRVSSLKIGTCTFAPTTTTARPRNLESWIGLFNGKLFWIKNEFLLYLICLPLIAMVIELRQVFVDSVNCKMFCFRFGLTYFHALSICWL